MRYRSAVLTALAIACASGLASARQADGMKATATIKGDGISGTLTLVERKMGTGTVVDLTLTVKGLKPGLHGVHLHAVGKCEPDFTAAGGHSIRARQATPIPMPIIRSTWAMYRTSRSAPTVPARSSGDDARDPVARAIVAVRRRRIGDHHSWKSRSGNDRRAEVGGERRPEGCLWRDHEAVAPASASHSFSSPGAPPRGYSPLASLAAGYLRQSAFRTILPPTSCLLPLTSFEPSPLADRDERSACRPQLQRAMRDARRERFVEREHQRGERPRLGHAHNIEGEVSADGPGRPAVAAPGSAATGRARPRERDGCGPDVCWRVADEARQPGVSDAAFRGQRCHT